MVTALTHLQAFDEMIPFCTQALKIYPKNNVIRNDFRDDLEQRQRHPGETLQAQVYCPKYPWIPSAMVQRSDSLIAQVNSRLQQYAPHLEIRCSPIGGTPDCLGMFATKEIRPNELLFTRPKHSLAVHNGDPLEYCDNCAANWDRNRQC